MATAVANAQARTGTVDITIVSRSSNAVRVDEHIVLAPSSQPIELRVITRPCMQIDNLVIARDGRALDVEELTRGPWTTLRDTSTSATDSVRLTVGYNVWLGGSRTIPLVHLTSPVASTVSSGSGSTKVVVRFSHDSGTIEFPYMTRQAANEWSAGYVATPSFLKVGGFTFPCDRMPPPGDDGGLVWRFTLLLGIMAAWVPVYLVWARRTGDRA